LRQRQPQLPWAAETNAEFFYELANFNLFEDEERVLSSVQAMLINFIVYFLLIFNFSFFNIEYLARGKTTIAIMDLQ
jgi:hypothetical protein